MENSKYGKYIITELKENIAEAEWTNPIQKAGRGKGGRVLLLDSEVIPGAFYVETAWTFPRKATDPPRRIAEAHKHDFDEVLSMFGSDTDNPNELNGEVEFWQAHFQLLHASWEDVCLAAVSGILLLSCLKNS